MDNNCLYGSFRNLKFNDIWEDPTEFIDYYSNCGIPAELKSEDSVKTIFYLLTARYGNSTIASSNIEQFKLKVMSIIFQYGGTWEKELEIQRKVRELSDADIETGSVTIFNHSFNPSTEPSTDSLTELPTINEQNTNRVKRNKIDAYASVLDILKKDVSEQFLSKFKKLFLYVVQPEAPLWYETEVNN